MSTYGSRLITPPKEEEEIYPYRRAWNSIVIESALLFAITLGVFLATRFIDVPQRFLQPAGAALALAPLGLWLAFSWWPERFVPQPRARLLALLVVAALAANAVGIPMVENVFQVDRWLPLENAINRIVGYSFTEGLTHATLSYLTLRYVVWSDCFRTRQDAVAYAAACAVGYATVANLDIALSGVLPVDVASFRFFDTMAVQLAVNLVVSFGLSEVRFKERVFPPLLSTTLMLGALISGAARPLRAGLTNASLGILRSDPDGPVQGFVFLASPIRGFLFSAALVIVMILTFNFLFTNAERQDAEAAAQREAA